MKKSQLFSAPLAYTASEYIHRSRIRKRMPTSK